MLFCNVLGVVKSVAANDQDLTYLHWHAVVRNMHISFSGVSGSKRSVIFAIAEAGVGRDTACAGDDSGKEAAS